jgi:adenosylcobyric acid synthase
MSGGLLVAGTASDVGKSWVVTGLCRALARRGVRVAPFKAQNMSLNARVTVDGGEIGVAQWVQARAAGIEPEVGMNPVLLKPTGDRTSEVIVLGQVVEERDAHAHQARASAAWPVVLDALAELRSRFDVVLCEGAGGAAEINLLHADLANLPLARATGLPAIVLGDIERGGVFASLYGTYALLPRELSDHVAGFVINRFRGDPTLLGDGLQELERRTGVPTLGVIPVVDGPDLDAEDSLALDRPPVTRPVADRQLDVAAIRYPLVSNFGDLDPLHIEPDVRVRWVRTVAELGRPDLVVLPGSKATRRDLEWLRSSGLAEAIRPCRAVLAICAGAQMVGDVVRDPHGVEGPAGEVAGLGLLRLATEFQRPKLLDRPVARSVAGPGRGSEVNGYRIHHGRILADAEPWLLSTTAGEVGWLGEGVCATTLHGFLEHDELRAGVLSWAAVRAGRGIRAASHRRFESVRTERFDRIADVLEANLDVDALLTLIDARSSSDRSHRSS